MRARPSLLSLLTGPTLMAVLALAGCTSTDFAGGSNGSERRGGTGDANPDAGAPDAGDPSDPSDPLGMPFPGGPGADFDVPSDCTEDGVTQARLLTEEVKNGSEDDYIEYEISVSDCEGKATTIRPDKVLFDTNSFISGAAEAIEFEVRTKEGESVTKGTMEVVKGKDLFGVVSDKHFHHQTDQTIEFDAPAKAFIFRVQPGKGRLIATENEDDPDAAAEDQKIETYLRFGAAKPVTKVVLFTND